MRFLCWAFISERLILGIAIDKSDFRIISCALPRRFCLPKNGWSSLLGPFLSGHA